MVSSEQYVDGANVLRFSTSKHLDPALHSEVGFFAMLIIENEATVRIASKLRGWQLCFVHLIEPARSSDVTFARFKQQFTKLHVWNFDVFERIVYIDSDALVVDDISALFKQTGPLAGVKDWERGAIRDHFNMGVFSLAPNRSEFERLDYARLHERSYRLSMAEQGLLNHVYNGTNGDIDMIQELPFDYNGNVAAAVQAPEFWREHRASVKVLHFTWIKPFIGDYKAHPAYARLSAEIALWWRYSKEMSAAPAALRQSRADIPTSTIVTSLYLVAKSKHSDADYMQWLRNFLRIRTPIVLFTDHATSERVFRGENASVRLPDNVHVVLRELDDFMVSQRFDWNAEFRKDPEQQHSPALYKIWNEKANLVRIAMENRFHPLSTCYFWVDAGCFRIREVMPSYRDWPNPLMCAAIRDSLVLLQVEPFTASELESEPSVSDWSLVNRIGGTIFGGSHSALRLWVDAYYATLQRFFDAGRFAGKDQSVMAETVLEVRRSRSFNVTLVDVPVGAGGKQKWFHLQPFLLGVGADAKRFLKKRL
jgi:lipopolysaccharide biosynthesis glycosyltransferase